MKRRLFALVLSLSMLPSCLFLSGCGSDKEEVYEIQNSSETSSQESSSALVSSEVVSVEVEDVSSDITGEVSSAVSSSTSTSSKGSTSSKKTTSTTSTATSNSSKNGNYTYNSNLDIEDNVFMDALIYTGYNMKKHRADGNMWVYILAARKRGLGYLSNISFGGGSSGYETTSAGTPDLKAFQRGGFVCASFVTYVYFNYLPNVAGIDTSSLTKPAKSNSANSWYTAAKDWVKKGYSRYVSFSAKDSAAGIKFSLDEDVPIGSVIFFRNWDEPNSKEASHVVIYAGKKNGYHWVYHTGNKNGPEMCAVERMKFGPDPQWPIAVITAPNNIRLSAGIEVTLKDNEGNPIPNVQFSLKNKSTGKTVDLGKTDSKGVVSKEGLQYGDYTLTQLSLPEGYTAEKTVNEIKLTTKENSSNKITVVNNIIPPVVESSSVANTSSASSGTESTAATSGESSSGATSSTASSTPATSMPAILSSTKEDVNEPESE